jgi:hypothetical protein
VVGRGGEGLEGEWTPRLRNGFADVVADRLAGDVELLGHLLGRASLFEQP